ncbi:MAG: bacitracin ABC transporter ATP-binding protein [Oceanospirillaceae bacterium]|uniref:ABC transporter ATP-binding protein n=1 Tax=unclassified Thalassolituus TaxID=2624967 RepID=UPI000C62872D|nr:MULTISPECIES: ABC transporter ATP-binding protein [unclassified Thalassolituus]MAS24700.1 bacitracin ABC transporter ATP-binding protein [Oceanospirillaceae bacterium]MBS52292.1 bacitracin ABC transporter ATP-binding protein [Oceanospirillaceae bacterium]|tara:strand:- start:1928 stop:2818 length:891 start_codon:yes stop_codon:yes gene_type:complete
MNKMLEITGAGIEFNTPKGSFRALRDVNLKIQQGEFVSLIGHSGCGKSTVLNIVAGLLQATEGGVVLNGKEVNEPGPERAVVFQNHSLLPWLSAYENVELAVKQVFKGKKSKAEMKEWIEHNLGLVHMTHAMHKRPDEISGGMKQRVGIARALAMEPDVLLMDEPFGALDALTRAHLQDSLMEIQKDLNNTVIMITHDVDEAVLLSDRIVMMTNGPAATIGEILDVNLERPRNRLELADDPAYNHYRAAVLSFLYEKQKKVDSTTSSAPQANATKKPEPVAAPAIEPAQEPEKKIA